MTTDKPAGAPAWVVVLIVVISLFFGFLTTSVGRIQHGSAETTFPIIPLEVAGNGDKAEQILSETVDLLATTDTEKPDVRGMVEAAVRESLWWDFGFILGYSLLIFVVAPILGRRLGGPIWTWLGRTVG